jgi:hypothetical protein
MDLQERTRMQDTYVRMENIIDSIGKLGVFPPLVWVWTWDVTKSMYEDFKDGGDPEYGVTMELDEVWEQFWKDADKNGFTLEYGVEDLSDAVRDWLINSGIVEEVPEDEEEDEDEDE